MRRIDAIDSSSAVTRHEPRMFFCATPAFRLSGLQHVQLTVWLKQRLALGLFLVIRLKVLIDDGDRQQDARARANSAHKVCHNG